MNERKKPIKKNQSYEKKYLEIVKNIKYISARDDESLEQPHALKFVDSVTTYGAYQKPL